MLYGSPAHDEFGFSLNPFHYVKKAGHYAKKAAVGLYHIDKRILSNKAVQQAATTAANVYAPGSGAAVQAGLNVIAPSGGGGTVATPAPHVATPAPHAATPQTAASNANADADDGGGGHGGGGDQLFGMPKKYVMIGGGVLGVVVLLSLLRK